MKAPIRRPSGLSSTKPTIDPPTLLAKMIAAHDAGDWVVEQLASAELQRQGIHIGFFAPDLEAPCRS